MKSALVRSLIAVLFCVCVRLTLAGDFHSAVISTGASLPDITVADQHFIRIRNFTQDNNGTRGTVTVKLGTSGAPVVVLVAAAQTTSAAPEAVNSIVIAGPATITIKASLTGNTFVTYIKEKDSD
jgi:hypothetical protein